MGKKENLGKKLKKIRLNGRGNGGEGEENVGFFFKGIYRLKSVNLLFLNTLQISLNIEESHEQFPADELT